MSDSIKRPCCESIQIPARTLLWEIKTEGETGDSYGEFSFYVLTDGDIGLPSFSEMNHALLENHHNRTISVIHSVRFIGEIGAYPPHETHPNLSDSEGCFNLTSLPLTSRDVFHIANMVLWDRTPFFIQLTKSNLVQFDHESKCSLKRIVELSNNALTSLPEGQTSELKRLIEMMVYFISTLSWVESQK